MRFLSHAETIRVFQRACVRAGVQIAYSQGFNPHQKMSLVPPRSVGVESNDDLLCLWLKGVKRIRQIHRSELTLTEGRTAGRHRNHFSGNQPGQKYP